MIKINNVGSFITIRHIKYILPPHGKIFNHSIPMGQLKEMSSYYLIFYTIVWDFSNEGNGIITTACKIIMDDIKKESLLYY